MTTPPDTCPGLAELRESLCRFPSRDLRGALPFAAFAARCVREVPPGSAHSASAEVTDPRLRDALGEAERWLSSPSPDPLLLDASDLAFLAAAEAGGPSPEAAVGVGAAAWAVACAVASAAYAAAIGVEPIGDAPAREGEDRGGDASRYAILAASCAARSAGLGGSSAVEFQMGLIREIWTPDPAVDSSSTPGRQSPT
jgi:hypothetical protein